MAHGDIPAISAYDKKRSHAHVSLELHHPKCSVPRHDCCLSFALALLGQEGVFILLLSKCCGSDVIQESSVCWIITVAEHSSQFGSI